MNKQQTAVEWLLEALDKTLVRSIYERLEREGLFEEAKAMFRQQIEEAYSAGEQDGETGTSFPEPAYKYETAADYYNEKYGS